MENSKTGSIVLVLSGMAKATMDNVGDTLSVQRGSVFFWPATSPQLELRLCDCDGESGDFVAYQAMCNDFEE